MTPYVAAICCNVGAREGDTLRIVQPAFEHACEANRQRNGERMIQPLRALNAGFDVDAGLITGPSCATTLSIDVVLPTPASPAIQKI